MCASQRLPEECVQHSYFMAQKPAMILRMKNKGGKILSLDFVYGPGKQVAVFNNKTPFNPWIGMVTIKIKYNMVIWFGFLKNSESIKEIEPLLRRLK